MGRNEGLKKERLWWEKMNGKRRVVGGNEQGKETREWAEMKKCLKKEGPGWAEGGQMGGNEGEKEGGG